MTALTHRPHRDGSLIVGVGFMVVGLVAVAMTLADLDPSRWLGGSDPVILALFSNAGDKLTGQRYVAVDWDAKLGDDPEKQPHRQAAWPELARPLASTKK